MPQDGDDTARLQVQFLQFPSVISCGIMRINKQTTPTIGTTLSPPQPTDTQCQNGSTYSSPIGRKFSLVCGVNWWPDSLFLNYTTDFDTCLNGCAEWNMNNTESCVGVSFIEGIFGPRGEAGGSQCFYKWRILWSGSLDTLSDSAQVQVNNV